MSIDFNDYQYNAQPVTKPFEGLQENPLLENWYGKMFGGKDQPGWFGQTTQGIGSLVNAYAGLKQLGLSKDALNSQKAFSSANLANQAALANRQLEDRERAKLAYAGIHGDSPQLQAYMDKYRLKDKV